VSRAAPGWAAGALLALALHGLAAPVAGAEAPAMVPKTTPIKPAKTKPHLALVLSGGGARGAAHIGVLKVLDEMHIKPDLIVGTSMGSIIGGLYAAGYSAKEIAAITEETDWKHLFVDRVDRPDRSYRRKQDDTTLLIPLRLRFKGWKPYLPTALLGGQRLDLLLRSLEIQATSVRDFDDLPIPFRAVAANLENGNAVVIDHGSLSTAMRASMAIAGLFPPVEMDGMKLIDGGAAANLPIGIAQALGAEKIIAVDITSPLGALNELGSVFQIYNQWTGYVTEVNRREDLKKLRPGDILIRPDLGDISFMAFDQVEQAAEIGERAARASADQLRPLAASDAAWKSFEEKHHRCPPEETRVDRIKIVNRSWVDDDIIAAHVKMKTGGNYDPQQVSEQVMQLHGLDYSGTITADLDRTDDHGVLTLTVPEKPYGHNSLQFGASFRDDFEGDTGYALSVRHLQLASNARGGEWENVAQIGENEVLRTEFYQPFDAKMAWFAAVGGGVRGFDSPIWSDNEVLAEYRVARSEGHVDFGRVFGRWGEIRAGTFYAFERGTLRVGQPEIPDYKEHDAGYSATFNVDTLDATVFPYRGTWVQSRYYDSRAVWGADLDRTHAQMTVAQAVTIGKVTIYPNASGCTNFDQTASLSSACRLGGFLRLSGLGQDQLLGDKSVFGGMLFYYALARLDIGALTQGMYAGMSLETGNTYLKDDPIGWSSLRRGGSIFLGARTVIGPVYLGYGYTEGGNSRIYFLIGQRF
jgi:NTE family protein